MAHSSCSEASLAPNLSIPAAHLIFDSRTRSLFFLPGLGLAVSNSFVNELAILGLLGGGKNQGGVGGSILGFVLGDGYTSYQCVSYRARLWV